MSINVNTMASFMQPSSANMYEMGRNSGGFAGANSAVRQGLEAWKAQQGSVNEFAMQGIKGQQAMDVQRLQNQGAIDAANAKIANRQVFRKITPEEVGIKDWQLGRTGGGFQDNYKILNTAGGEVVAIPQRVAVTGPQNEAQMFENAGVLSGGSSPIPGVDGPSQGLTPEEKQAVADFMRKNFN